MQDLRGSYQHEYGADAVSASARLRASLVNDEVEARSPSGRLASGRLSSGRPTSARLSVGPPASVEGVVALTDATFDREVLNHPQPVVVDFWTQTCVPCRAQATIMGRLASAFGGRVKFGRFKVDDNPEVPEAYGIKGVPHLLALLHGEVILELVGGYPFEQLRERLRGVGIA